MSNRFTDRKWKRNPAHHEWTVNEIEYLRVRWMQGDLLKQIAVDATAVLGFNVTIGMVNGITVRNRDKFPERKPHPRKARAAR